MKPDKYFQRRKYSKHPYRFVRRKINNFLIQDELQKIPQTFENKVRYMCWAKETLGLGQYEDAGYFEGDETR